MQVARITLDTSVGVTEAGTALGVNPDRALTRTFQKLNE
jgi:hypothetical protein